MSIDPSSLIYHFYEKKSKTTNKKGAEALQEMINTLLFTLAGLVNVMGLLFLLFFVYTVMGVQLFAKIAYNGELDPHANFRSFSTAMLTVFYILNTPPLSLSLTLSPLTDISFQHVFTIFIIHIHV
jgi:uncharacterized membrane protein YhaH (DUF805 family)